MNLFHAHSSPDLSLALPTEESCTRLFGVDLSKPPMKKFKSMIDLNTYPSSSDRPSLSTNQSRPPSSSSSDRNYHSGGGVPKKKYVSVRWTKEEHMRFLEGLQALGMGDWAGIAKDYVITKNTTQVTNHAHKHFLYQYKNASKQRRGSSIFDLPPPPPQPAPQRQMNNVENPTPVCVRIPFWMHIGVSNSAPNLIRPLVIRVNPNMQRQ